ACGAFALVFFVLKAVDGIRAYKVTGVQTCALPICLGSRDQQPVMRQGVAQRAQSIAIQLRSHKLAVGKNQSSGAVPGFAALRKRSEERRVGKGVASRATHAPITTEPKVGVQAFATE